MEAIPFQVGGHSLPEIDCNSLGLQEPRAASGVDAHASGVHEVSLKVGASPTSSCRCPVECGHIMSLAGSEDDFPMVPS